MDARALVLDDAQLLEELGWVRGVAQRLLADPNDADDVVQETWLRTRRAEVQFESRGRLRAWLAAVVRRMARDTLRARRRRALREQRAARLEARQDADDVVERSAALERLLQAVRALQEPQRSTVLLRYLDGYSTAEIAAAMSVSEELVRKRLARTRAQLRTTLGLEPAPRKGAAGALSASLLTVLLVLGLGGPAQAPGSLREGASGGAAEPGLAQETGVRAERARAPVLEAASLESVSSEAASSEAELAPEAELAAQIAPARAISLSD